MATAEHQRTDAQAAVGAEPRFRRLLASPAVAGLATSLLLYCSFFPLNWGWLGWVALVPLLSLVQRPERKGIYWWAWLSGLLFAVPALQWVRLASLPMYATWAGLAVFVSLHFLLFAWITRRLTLTARLPLLLVAPVVWVALEYARAHVGIGFAWYYLGHTQHDFLAVIQIADLFGAYGVGFLVMLVNVVVFQWCSPAWSRRRAGQEPEPMTRLLRLPAMIGVLALLAGTLIYGYWRLGQTDFRPGPRLALLQGNLPQDIRNDPAEALTVARHFITLADEAAKLSPDLIVWSETSLSDPWFEVAPERIGGAGEWAKWQQETRETADAMHERWKVPLLLGASVRVLEKDGEHKYNSAVLTCGGQPLGRYDKMYRVPFGEYVPWEGSLPFMRWFTPYEDDYSITAGTRHTVFSMPPPGQSQFAVLICYEDTVPHLPRKFMRLEDKWDFRQPYRGPDFFVNISNDGWFKGSAEHEQHLVGARFRAVECRRAVARAVNMGVSGVIDGNGRLVALPGSSWKESKARKAVVLANVPIDRRESLYVRWGDILPVSCWLLIGAGLLLCGIQWWRGK